MAWRSLVSLLGLDAAQCKGYGKEEEYAVCRLERGWMGTGRPGSAGGWTGPVEFTRTRAPGAAAAGDGQGGGQGQPAATAGGGGRGGDR